MNYGYFDITILIFIFFGLQLWWLLPLIKTNKRIEIENTKSIKNIDLLERIYKK